jgi:hypothetical protein
MNDPLEIGIFRDLRGDKEIRQSAQLVSQITGGQMGADELEQELKQQLLPKKDGAYE